MMKNKFKGTIVPVVAPITSTFQLDADAVEKIFSYLYLHHASPFILGTTGESASLSKTYKKQFIEKALACKKSDSSLYVGISSNIVEESIDFAKRALDLGADAVVATLPTYYQLSYDQMKRYFLDLADEIAGPLVIYNIPATTHMSVPLSLIDEISQHPNIIGTKDSERSTERLDESLSMWKNRSDFNHYIGWAAKSAYAMINGSCGIVPSTGNFMPSIYHDLITAVEEGNHEKAYHLQEVSDALGDIYQQGRSLGESLWGLKVLMGELGLCNSYMMPPLYKLSKVEEMELIKKFHELIELENISLSNLTNHV